MQNKKHIYVIQMHTGTLPSKLVRLVTQYEYSHVVISLDRDCKTTYSFGRKDINNFLKGGFVEETQCGAFFEKFNKTNCRIYEIEVTEKQYACLKSSLSHRKANKNDYKYDFAGVILRFLRIPIAFGNRSVCSQFVADILEENNVTHFEKPTCFIKVSDFDNRRDFKTIYEGLYSEYCPGEAFVRAQ